MSAVLDPSTTANLSTTASPVEYAPPRDTAVMPGFGSQNSWELANRIGKAFAASSIVPEIYRGNVANCIVALEMANRIGASPMMVMQNLYVVHGNPGWSAKFLIACFNQCGRYSALRYEWEGKRGEKGWGCRAWAIEKATGERLVGATVTVQMADDEGWSEKKGSKWKTMPEQMLMYRSAAFMIRTYAPEISMGLRTDDEIIDTIDEIRQTTGSLKAVRSALDDADSVTGETSPPPASASAAASASSTKAKPEADATSLARFMERLNKTADKEIAALVMDEARDLTDAEYEQLRVLYATKFPGA